jgi:hypothetical protein
MLTPYLAVAVKWPSAPGAQLVVSIRPRADPAPQSLRFHRVSSAESKHKRTFNHSVAVIGHAY